MNTSHFRGLRYVFELISALKTIRGCFVLRQYIIPGAKILLRDFVIVTNNEFYSGEEWIHYLIALWNFLIVYFSAPWSKGDKNQWYVHTRIVHIYIYIYICVHCMHAFKEGTRWIFRSSWRSQRILNYSDRTSVMPTLSTYLRNIRICFQGRRIFVAAWPTLLSFKPISPTWGSMRNRKL